MELPVTPSNRYHIAQKAIGVTSMAFAGAGMDHLDVRRFWRTLVRERNLVFILTTVAFLGALFHILFSTSLYSATAQLILDSPQPKITRGEAVVSGLDTNRFTLGPVIDSEVEILQSAPLAERVIRAARLLEDPGFVGRPGILSVVIQPVTRLVAWITGQDEKSAPEIPPSLIRRFLAQLEVKRKGLSLILLVKFTDYNPERAARVANQIAVEYLNMQREYKLAIVKQAGNRLQAQVDQSRALVVDAEQQVQRYRQENNLVSVGGMSIGEREMTDTLLQLAAARADFSTKLAEKEEAERISTDPTAINSMSRVLRSEVITNLRRQEAEVMRKIATLVSQFGGQHQQVERTQAELRDLRGEIDAEIVRLVQSARNDYAVAASRVKQLEQKAEHLKEASLQRSVLAIKLAELERQSKVASDLFYAQLSRLGEVQAQESMVYEDARIVAEASVPVEPAAPKKSLVLALALLGGAGLGTTLALLKDQLSTKIRSREDAERSLGMRVVAELPTLDSGQDGAILRETVHDMDSGYAEGLFTLRHWLLEEQPKLPGKIVALASASPGIGKTAIAANLARYAARVQIKTLLLDCNLRNPSLTAEFGRNAAFSLSDVIMGRASLADAIVPDAQTGLHFCAGGSTENRLLAMEMLSSSRLGALLRSATEQYDLVIVDTSALLPWTYVRTLLERVDTIAMVIEANRTSTDEMAEVRRLVPALASKPVGLILNRTESQTQLRPHRLEAAAAKAWSAVLQLVGRLRHNRRVGATYS